MPLEESPMRHSPLWLAALALALVACSTTRSKPQTSPDLFTIAEGDSIGGPPLIDGLPECEAR
jgi:hypothetical protein